jgi:glutaconate CoA-transferase subunit B
LAQEQLGGAPALWGHGGAYDPRGEIALFERSRLFNRKPRARLNLAGVLETLSRGTRLLATPAQIDGQGNANLSVIGTWSRPKVALVGTRGLPDATEIHFVMPTHTSRQLVERVDFVSTCAANRRTAPCLFTEFGVLQWSSNEQAWRLMERQPGIPVQQVQQSTGFRVLAAEVVPEIPDPPVLMLQALAQIDPRRVRDLDFGGAGVRQQMMLDIEQAERAARIESNEGAS